MSPESGFARRRAALVLGTLLVLATAVRPARPDAAAETVVLVSFDGMRWDAPARADAPNLRRLARAGVEAARGLVPPFPASTFPAHATLVTGAYPDRHGIVNNEFLDRERGLFKKDDDASWLLREPLWATAERQGVRAAVYHWVCAGAFWRGVAPSIRVAFDPGPPDSEAVDRIIDWLGSGGPGRPRLILAYLHGPDAAGHREGALSRAVLDEVARCDRLVGRLLQALDRLGRPVVLLLVSDHGMSDVTTPIDLRRLLAGAAPGASAIGIGGTSNIYCPRPAGCAAAESILSRVPGLTVYRRDDLPPELHYRLAARSGDLVAVAPRGSYFADREPRRGPRARGMHGYRPEEPEMRGIFYAWGAGIRQGSRPETVRMIDVDPLICRLLGIEPPAGIDGRVPEELLVMPAGPPAPVGADGPP